MGKALSLTAPQVARTFEATPHRGGSPPSAISVRRLARSKRCDGCLLYQCAHCGNSYPSIAVLQQPIRLAISLCQPTPVSFFRKETGAPTTAASHEELRFAPTPLVTISVTNAEVTSNSDVDDFAADQGMDCTWLTARHAPVIASLLPPDSGSRGAGFVSQCSLHPPTGNGAQEARS